jgi:hypothetical protein
MMRCEERTGAQNLENLGQLDFTSIASGIAQALAGKGDITKYPLSTALKSLSFSTSFSPVQRYTGVQLEQDDTKSPPNPYLTLVKPTLELDTIFGKKTFAPYGVADTVNWKENVAQVGLFFGSIFLLTGVGLFVVGRAVGRRGG